MRVTHHAERDGYVCDDYVRMIATAHHAERDDYVLRRRASARRADLQFASVIRSESRPTIVSPIEAVAVRNWKAVWDDFQAAKVEPPVHTNRHECHGR